MVVEKPRSAVAHLAGTQSGLPLGVPESTRFRSLAARFNYLAVARVDIQFATKNLCRFMERPVAGCWEAGNEHAQV